MDSKKFTHKVMKFSAGDTGGKPVGPFQGTAEECRQWVALQHQDGHVAVGDYFWIVDLRHVLKVETTLKDAF